MPAGNDHPQRGLDLGYARVSTTMQSLERQLDALSAAGILTTASTPTRRPARPSTVRA